MVCLQGDIHSRRQAAPRVPGVPWVQNGMKSEGGEEKRSKETRKKQNMKQGKQKERKGGVWSFCLKIQSFPAVSGQ